MLCFNQYLEVYEIDRDKTRMGLVRFEDRQLFIPQKKKHVMFSTEGHHYTQTNITPFKIPIFWLN